MIATIQIDDDVAVLTLDTPNPMNALTLDSFAELHGLMRGLAEDDAVRAVILTGAGPAFCAGAALDSFLDGDRVRMSEEDMRAVFETGVKPLLDTMVQFPKPIVTAINGTVAGGGMGLALLGDIVIAADTATFHSAFVGKLGLMPDIGVSWLLPNLMGRNRALPFALLGDRLTAAEAQAAGLIYRAVDPDRLMDTARGYADRLKSAPAEVLRQARVVFTDALSETYGETVARECDANTRLVQGPYLAEGVKAFLEKRAPDFYTQTPARSAES